jgi:hypothetical protein
MAQLNRFHNLNVDILALFYPEVYFTSSHQTVLLLHGAMSLRGVFLAPKQSSGS